MTAIIFPGQGSQYVGMSRDFYENSKIAKSTLEEIEDYVEMNIKELIFNDDSNLLNTTKYTQISIFAASLLIFKTLENETDLVDSSINIMMGHSLGEYTALACSKKLSLRDCSIILKKRGSLMHDAVETNKSGMVAVIGKDNNYIQDIIKKNNLKLQIANDNSPIQVVLSGNIKEIQNSKTIFLDNDIKRYIILNVSAAFHSNYMTEAQSILSSEIEKLDFIENKIQIISNYTAEISNDNGNIKAALKMQMANKVRWTESIRALENSGENKILEIGPNKILSGLIKRISNNFDIKSIDKMSEL